MRQTLQIARNLMTQPVCFSVSVQAWLLLCCAAWSLISDCLRLLWATISP
jgi:ABC-type phosphonate transport system ATPase subunit